MEAPVPGLTSIYGKRPTTVGADRMRPWIHVTALEVYESDISSIEDEENLDD